MPCQKCSHWKDGYQEAILKDGKQAEKAEPIYSIIRLKISGNRSLINTILKFQFFFKSLSVIVKFLLI